jgi:hypothetical protein
MQLPALSYQDRNLGKKIGHPRRMKQPSSQGFHREREREREREKEGMSTRLSQQIIILKWFIILLSFTEYFHRIPHRRKNPSRLNVYLSLNVPAGNNNGYVRSIVQ